MMEEEMELRPRSHQKLVELMNKGVDIPNPLTLDIGEEVRTENISGNGVKIYPGCRIYGEATVIAHGAKIGAEGPVTIDNCQIGSMAELKGGYFKGSVFLAKAKMGLGAHVREACILEEEANGAHCVGLKQTILFPFVTLGSLINFCDCLMAGGKSRKDHSEVGSSYIHFNFTPDGNKTTPSLIGDVPRGVMLNQPAVFLGGQGGMVGPLRLGYGSVSVAGTILRNDTLEGQKMITAKTYPPSVVGFEPHRYSNLDRILKNNIIFLANLVALEYWYKNVRKQFFSTMEFGELLYQGALDKLALAKKERTGRIEAMVGKVPPSHEKCRCRTGAEKRLCELHAATGDVCELFKEEASDRMAAELGGRFLNAFEKHRSGNRGDYVQVIQSMPETISRDGVRWLQHVVDALCKRAGALLSSFGLF
jgi:bifunctional UDP-N-acetylglucosamine pyrophosphorylase / glucosamine-1-phosphate N-acetyltransferase